MRRGWERLCSCSKVVTSPGRPGGYTWLAWTPGLFLFVFEEEEEGGRRQLALLFQGRALYKGFPHVPTPSLEIRLQGRLTCLPPLPQRTVLGRLYMKSPSYFYSPSHARIHIATLAQQALLCERNAQRLGSIKVRAPSLKC